MSNPRRRAIIAQLLEEGAAAARTERSRHTNPHRDADEYHWRGGFDEETERLNPPPDDPREIIRELIDLAEGEGISDPILVRARAYLESAQ